MAMPKRGENKLADLTAEVKELRKDATKSRKDIVALKARIVDAESRLAKAETALGTIGKGGAEAEEPPTAPEQQPETE